MFSSFAFSRLCRQIDRQIDRRKTTRVFLLNKREREGEKPEEKRIVCFCRRRRSDERESVQRQICLDFLFFSSLLPSKPDEIDCRRQMESICTSQRLLFFFVVMLTIYFSFKTRMLEEETRDAHRFPKRARKMTKTYSHLIIEEEMPRAK